MFLSRQDGPPFPASLTALHLESGYPVDLAELARGQEPLTAASNAVLSVRSGVICCSLEWLAGDGRNDASAPRRLASKLPAGFTGLELEAQCVTINCSAAAPLPDPVAAAWELGLFFAHTPPSYRRFSLRWRQGARLPLRVHLSWPLGVAEPGSTALARQGRVAFTGPDEIARHLRDCARLHGMSVAVPEAQRPWCQIVVVRS